MRAENVKTLWKSIETQDMTARIYGLVLAGGRSTRMGRDKGKIEYHGKAQREYLYELLSEICEAVYLSVRAEQEREISVDLRCIADDDTFPGPFNGILSAHKRFPEVAWLVVATDLPFISAAELRQLLKARNEEKAATAFATRNTKLPEPLCCIWEPQTLRESLQYLDKGNGSSPRDFLIKKNVEIVYPDDDRFLINANDPADHNLVLKQIEQREF